MILRVDVYVPSAQRNTANALMDSIVGESAQTGTFTQTKLLGGSTYYWCSIVFADFDKNESQWKRFRAKILSIPGAFWYAGSSRMSIAERTLQYTNSASAVDSIGNTWTIASSDADVPNASLQTYETVYAAPDGSASNIGTSESPFDLRTVTEGYIQADTVILKDGTYSPVAHDWNHSNVTIQAENTGMAKIDFVNTNTVQQYGYAVVIENIEFFSSYTTRETSETGSHPASIAGGAIHFRGSTTLRRCVLHDFNESFGAWGEASPFVAEDCVVFNNGWNAPDRGHGHALYSQNNSSINRKTFTRCIFVNGYGGSARLFGTNSPAALKGFTFTNCAFIANYKDDSNYAGTAELDSRSIVGSSESSIAADDIVFDVCHFIGTNLQFGFQDTRNVDATVQNSYMDIPILQINNWDALTIDGCQINVGRVVKRLAQDTLSGIDNNAYYNSPDFDAEFDVALDTFTDWQQYYDANSTNHAGNPDDSSHVIAGSGDVEALIIIHNYTEASSVSVDVSTLSLASGTYYLHNAQDYFGDIREINYTSGDIEIDMSASSVAVPIGAGSALHDTILPRHGIFTLRLSG